MPRTQPDTQLRVLAAAAERIRAACPACRSLRPGELPCERCVRHVAALFAQRWREAQEERETRESA